MVIAGTMSNSRCCDNDGNNGNFTSNAYRISGSVSPTVEKCISHIIEKEGFVFCHVNVKNILTNGGNYFAVLQELDLNGKSANGNKEINLFIKNRMPNSEFNIIPFDKAYNREAFFYNELAKIYNQLQDNVSIPEEDRLRIAKSYDDSNSDVTILDNLNKKGYTSFDRLDTITLEFAQRSIKELAKFHGMSFVLKAKMPDFHGKRILPLKYLVDVNSDWEAFIESTYSEALTFLEDDNRRIMENMYPEIIKSYTDFLNVSDDEAICLCHGDYRPNNMLVLKKDGRIEDLIPVDYQLIACEKPASDLLYFLFTGTDQDFRVAHLDDLTELYYNTLEKFLKYFDISVNDVYTKKRFEEDFDEHINFGLLAGLILIPFILPDSENIPNLQNSITDIKFTWNNLAIKRWREMVEDYISWKKLK